MNRFHVSHPFCRRLVSWLLLVVVIIHASGCITTDPRFITGAVVGAVVLTAVEKAHHQRQYVQQEVPSQPEPVHAIQATAYPVSTIDPGVTSASPQPWRELQPSPSGIKRKVLVLPVHCLYDQGLAAYQEGRYSEALTKLEQFTRIDLINTEEKIQALVYAAASAYLMGDINKSTRLVNTLLGIRPNPNIDADTFPPEFRLFVNQIRSASGR